MTQGSRAEPGTCEPVWGWLGRVLVPVSPGSASACSLFAFARAGCPVAGISAGWTGCRPFSWLTRLQGLGKNAGHVGFSASKVVR